MGLPRGLFTCLVGAVNSANEKFYVHNEQNGDSSLINTKYPKEKHDYKRIEVAQYSINTVFKKSGFSSIDVLNIDVEGAEFEIVSSWDFSLYTPKVIIIEIHDDNVINALKTDVAKTLMENGYKCVGVAVITYFFMKI